MKEQLANKAISKSCVIEQRKPIKPTQSSNTLRKPPTKRILEQQISYKDLFL
jgi:hypothetical protein